MRVATAGGDTVAQQEWANHLLAVGDGDGDFALRYKVRASLSMPPGQRSVEHLIGHVFGDLKNDPAARSCATLMDRAILCPLNKEVAAINEQIICLLPGTEREYLSADSTVDDDDNNSVYPDDLLNLEFSGIPSHRLVLKEGAMIILLRNLNAILGLVNGTRLMVTGLKDHVLGCLIASGAL
jgi:ATP-dependent DNA helicase PIF1